MIVSQLVVFVVVTSPL